MARFMDMVTMMGSMDAFQRNRRELITVGSKRRSAAAIVCLFFVDTIAAKYYTREL
jgi:hypothetical protein